MGTCVECKNHFFTQLKSGAVMHSCHGNITIQMHMDITEKGDMDMKKRIQFYLLIKLASP